ncbi:ankyrin repeat protein [Emericellopsis atlantica]|uniref:Ankyrin repeat protein n=1 Tax=Emericellopsis atlantica TaxID=2614577 RepID=A0A9P7ZPK6_9HYPO|nr:ankyrin repeat protein [Emericellopsis atlantica]KAG9255835.1 ankyrin repeat protein [Emericellopsis atlantica]
MPSFRDLCSRPLRSRSDKHNSTVAPRTEDDAEKTIVDRHGLPDIPRNFVAHLNRNTDTVTQEVLEPFLQYELTLRKAFAQRDGSIDDMANLVHIYDPSTTLPKFRNIDREQCDPEKYLMRLSSDSPGTDRSCAVADSFEAYQRNFDAFTHSTLSGIDWSNVVAAGSSAMLPLLPHRTDVKIPNDPAVEDPLETYYQRTASSSDIDLFLYGLTEEAALAKISQLEAAIRRNQRLSHGCGLTIRTANAVTFVSPRWPFRHVQVILRLYRSISEILTGFDVDCACVAFDGKQVYSNPRGVAALTTRTNLIDLSRRSPSYENRLYKYRSHQFDAYWPALDRSQIDESQCVRTTEHPKVEGLARLLFFENLVKKYKNSYHQRRRLQTIDENGLPTHSGYAMLEIPYGERFTANKVRKFVAFHSKEPYIFGSVDKVLQGKTPESSKKNVAELGSKVVFLTDDPGRQMIGSFNPITEDDWTDMAYGKRSTR